jgi:G:T/U-mismatch repair DNA glycosylase
MPNGLRERRKTNSMSFHTLIIGTSKSKNVDAYYVEAKEKFWKLIHLSGLTQRQYHPEEYRLLQVAGIGFAELAFHHQVLGENMNAVPYSQDRQLNDDLEVIRKGIPDLQKFILESGAKRIVFNGKTAISAFFEFNETGTVEILNSQYVRNKGWEYGACTTWKGIEVYMLPNLSATASAEWKKQNGELHWMELWRKLALNADPNSKSVKKDKPGLTPTQKLWAGLFLFIFCIIAMFVYIFMTKELIKD